MKTTLAIDPSLICTGLAVFEDGVLKEATAIKQPKERKDLDVFKRSVLMSKEIVYWFNENFPAQGPYPIEIATEWPVFLPPGSSKPNPSGLFGLSAIATGVAALLTIRCHSYTPKQWQQGTSKTTKHAERFKSNRAHRISTRLSKEELLVFERCKTHDEIDAIGIGLHHLGRFERKRVFSRGK